MSQNEDSSTESEYKKREKYMYAFLRRESALRSFQQMHQNPIDEYMNYEASSEIKERFGLQDSDPWRRASGGVICNLCGMQFRYHPKDEEHALSGEGFDVRLCSGQIVHL